MYKALCSTILAVSLLVAAVAAGAVTVKQGPATATGAAAIATTAEKYVGDGSWYNDVTKSKVEYYAYWNGSGTEASNALGTFTIADIATISYRSKHGVRADDLEFYMAIYTEKLPGQVSGWYGSRLTAEPMYSANYSNHSDGAWNLFTTDATSSDVQLRFYDYAMCGNYGYYGEPTLQDLQAGEYTWPTGNKRDYRGETVKALCFSTGSAWNASFLGYLDAIIVTLKDGRSVTLDLEAAPSTVYVDDDYSTATPGWGYDHFAKIQDGINAVAAGGAVNVAAGAYAENLTITKRLTLQGAGSESSGTVIHPASQGISIAADGGSTSERITIKNLRITGASGSGNTGAGIAILDPTTGYLTFDNVASVGNGGHGICIVGTGGLTDIAITNCDLSGNGGAGFRVPASCLSVSKVRISGGRMDGNVYGMEAYATVTNKVLDDVVINGTTFNGNATKGLYLERLSNATLENLQVIGSGISGSYPEGIDINLKYNNYSNITIRNATVTGCGTGDPNGVGMAIKGRNDGSTYGANPASLSNLNIVGGTFETPSATQAAISIGNNVSNVSFSGGVNITGAGIGLVGYDLPAGPTWSLGNTDLAATLAVFGALTNSPVNIEAHSANFGGLTTTPEIEAKVYHHPDSAPYGPGWFLFGTYLAAGNTVGWDVNDGKFYLCNDATNPASGLEIAAGNTYIVGTSPATFTITGIPGDKTLVVNNAGTNSLRMVWYLRNGVFYRGVTTSTIGGTVTSASYQRGMTYTGGKWYPGLQFLTHTLSNGPTWTVTCGNATQTAP